MKRRPHPLSLLVPLLALFLLTTACGGEGEEGGALRVASFEPEGETDRFTNITVAFSRQVVSPDSTGEVLRSGPIRFEPPISGRFRWIAPSTLRFFPTEPLRPSTGYRAEITDELERAAGTGLRGKRSFTFHTPWLEVVRPSHYMERLASAPERGIFHVTLEFNAAVHPAALREHLRTLVRTGEEERQVAYQIVTSSLDPVMEVRTGEIDLGEGEGRLILA
ncbi:MAG: Ig-like domain-containing protein, partial [bacterium]